MRLTGRRADRLGRGRPARAGLLLVVLVPFATVVLAGDVPTGFPGKVSQVASPDGRFVLRNVDYDQEPYHVLYLGDVRRKTEEKLLAYGRVASALWSPDGRALLVNDYGGSDYSNCLVFLFGDGRTRIDVQAKLREQLGGDQTLFRNHHVYIEGVTWLGRSTVEVKVSGYGDVDPKGFTRFYEYPLGGRFRLLRKTASFEGVG